MADLSLFTGKYLDGAGLSILWDKIKKDFQPKGNYQPAGNYATIGGDNTFTGINTFANAAGVTAKKFVVDGGTASQLLLANGDLKAVSDFATAGHNHDDRYALENHNHEGVYQPAGDYAPAKDYAVRGEANNFTELNTFAKDVTIGSSSTAANLQVYGTGTFSDYVTAKGFKVADKTGFLKANGTIDDTNYLPLTGGTLTGPVRILTGEDDGYGDIDFSNGTITSNGLISKNGLLVGTDGGENVWNDAYVAMRYTSGTFMGQTTIASGPGEGEASINLSPVNHGDYGTTYGGFVDIFGNQISFNHIDETNKGIIFTPTLATFDVPTSATSITLSSAITQDTQATTKKYVDDKVSTAISALNDVIKLKGSVSSTSALPTSDVELGWAYVVSEAGTYAGEVCEVGDMIVCTAASPLAWTIIQRNIPGVLTADDINVILS